MTIELIVKGDHVTDVLAQIKQLADATGMTTPVNTVHQVKDVPLPSGQVFADNVDTEAPVEQGQVIETKPANEAPKKLSRSESMAAVKEMIESGEKDERYELLSRGSQKKIDEAHAQPAPVEDDVSGLFDEEPAAPAEVTADTIRELMGKLGKDKDGNQVRDNMLKIRDIFVKYIPEGTEVKVGNIPTDKLAEVYADMQKLGE